MSERIRLEVVTTMRYTNRRILYFTLHTVLYSDGAAMTSGGRPFQTRAAAITKALSPYGGP